MSVDLQEIESKVKDALNKIQHPGHKIGLMELGMYDRLEQEEDKYRLHLKAPDADRQVQISLETQIRGALKDLIPGKFKVRFSVDESLAPEDIGNRIRGIKNIIAVGSGKGGVGKSTVASNLAASMVARGLKVGLMDADIYGPSLGKMFGQENKVSLTGDGKNKVKPLEVMGLKLMSFAFLINPGQAVVWRGPMLGKAVEQFLFEIEWGELDFLIIDLPPGTGDVQLSLAQLVDLDGAVIVTTPQNVALQDANRARTMFQEVKVPILGVIENMSSFVCPSCGTVTEIFSKNGAQAFSAQSNVPLLGEIPLLKEIMESGDGGKPYVLENKEGPVAQAYSKAVDQLLVEVEKYK